MEESEIERELTEAQADVARIGEIRARRQRAVAAARAAGWTKYRIAAVLGVKAPTVDSIIETIRKESVRENLAAARDNRGP